MAHAEEFEVTATYKVRIYAFNAQAAMAVVGSHAFASSCIRQEAAGRVGVPMVVGVEISDAKAVNPSMPQSAERANTRQRRE